MFMVMAGDGADEDGILLPTLPSGKPGKLT